MYHMHMSFRSVGDYARGLRALREIVVAGREREAWQNSRKRPGPDMELIRVHFDAADRDVSLLIRAGDAYVIGVQNADATFYFGDSGPCRLIDNQVLLGFGGHYNDLGDFKSLGSLEKSKFEAAVEAASRWTRVSPPSSLTMAKGVRKQSPDARHLLTLILATSEAARFIDVGATVANALYGRRDRPLTLRQIDEFVHRWEKLSAQKFPVEVMVRVEH